MSENINARATQISARLHSRYPLPVTMLDWKNPWELLVATVLAAQCTDARVNMVTPEFFRRWPGPGELSVAPLDEVEKVVHSTGFFRQKAKNLITSAKRIIEVYGGKVPETMADLLTLPGVARKTANIVLSNALGKHEGIAVDTHVRRLSFRLGLTTSTNPTIIERDMMQLFPRDQWGDINHLLVLHGRDTCTARKPRCPDCILTALCPKHGLS
ncbi:endonuclease III [Desulfonatronum lacustre]|uniref:endonuclease III n=1 Tax=Desulfonatronum lacustre TaxID=66849 RepID=UPI00048DEF8E|nr:endonuclease III [Desulfonatronum lacustre]